MKEQERGLVALRLDIEIVIRDAIKGALLPARAMGSTEPRQNR